MADEDDWRDERGGGDGRRRRDEGGSDGRRTRVDRDGRVSGGGGYGGRDGGRSPRRSTPQSLGKTNVGEAGGGMGDIVGDVHDLVSSSINNLEVLPPACRHAHRRVYRRV